MCDLSHFSLQHAIMQDLWMTAFRAILPENATKKMGTFHRSYMFMFLCDQSLLDGFRLPQVNTEHSSS
jgi:hypothetical protein